jgi:hypothetical protein
MKEIILAMMVWIGGQTGLPVPELPIISVKTPTEIRQIAYECDKLKTENKPLYKAICIPDNDPKAIDVIAIYDRETGTIYLPTYFDKNNVAHRAILLHEIVHHLQYESDYHKTVQCMPLLEKQAYDLMDIWLEENNAVMPPELTIGPLLRFTLTNCMMSSPYVPENYRVGG